MLSRTKCHFMLRSQKVPLSHAVHAIIIIIIPYILALHAIDYIIIGTIMHNYYVWVQSL